MKKLIAITFLISCLYGEVFAQKGEVKTVVEAEQAFNKAVVRKGMKDAFLSVLDD